MTDSSETRRLASDGMRLIGAGDFRQGLPLLVRAVESKPPGTELPGEVYSHLGWGVARHSRQPREGLRLCEHAVKVEYYNAINHLHLARVRLILGDRRGAVKAITDGRSLDPSQPGLIELEREVGVRRPPVLGFLSRRHLLNQVLGKLRHVVAPGGAA